MKKYFILILLSLFLFGCEKREDRLVMVTEASFAPFEYYSDGKIVGVDVDIANEVAKRLGKKLVVKDVSFDSIITEIRSGKSDMGVAGISYTEERSKAVSFSESYTVSRQVAIVRKNSAFNNVNDMVCDKIAVQLGSIADGYVTDEFVNSKIIRQKKYLAAIEDLKDNKVDCVVMDELPAKEMVNENSNYIKILDGELAEDSYGIVVNKDNYELLNVINEVIRDLKSEGKIDEYILFHSKNG